MTEKLREKIAQEIYDGQFSGKSRYDTAFDILSLMLKEVEGARLTPEQMRAVIGSKYPLPLINQNLYEKMIAAQLEAVKKLLGKV